MGQKGTGPKFITRPVCMSSLLRNNSNTVYFNTIDIFITCSQYMARRCLTSPGAPNLWTRLGWLQGSTWNGMQWGALALLEVSHSRGCYLKFAVLLLRRVCSPNTKEPRALCPGGLYSWWHFASPANGSGSHSCAPVTWAYGIPCPAMVSPNAGPCKEDKLLYPDHHLIWCVESGFRPTHLFLLKRYNILYLDVTGTCNNTLLPSIVSEQEENILHQL